MSIATYDLASLTYDSATTTYDGGGLGLSNMPVVGVFISFTDGPYVVEPTWVEVTQYVRDINVRRGRGNDLQQFPTGSASVTLDNRTRLFDPFNTASIYNGNLKPRRQIKIVGQWLGVTYPIFRGFIAGWPVGYSDGGKDSTVEIDCFDALGLLAAETTSNDWAEYYTLQANPTRYWRCNDSAGSQVIREYISNNFTLTDNTWASPSVRQGVFIEAPPMAQGLLGNSARLRVYSNRTTGVAVDTPEFWITFWVQGARSSTTNSWIVFYELNGCNVEIYGNADNTMDIYGRRNTTLASLVEFTASQPIFDSPAHFAIQFKNDSASEIKKVYINNVEQPTTGWTFTNLVQTGAATETLEIQNCTIQEIAVFIGNLTTTQLTNIYEGGLGRITDSTADRFALLDSLTDFPAALTSFAATTVSSVSELTNSQYLLNEMQIVTDGEAGELYVDRSGVLKLVARDWFATSTRSNTSQVTFTDTGTGVFYDHASLRMAYDADLVRNDVTVSFTGNGNVNSVDATSVADFGSASETVSTYLADPTQAQTLADYLVTIYKNPKLRIEPFLVKGQRNPTYDFPLLLSLELLDRFTFVRTPSVGSAVTQDMLLQSIEHRITPNTWETVINGSARFTGWFTIGVSLLGGTDVLL